MPKAVASEPPFVLAETAYKPAAPFAVNDEAAATPFASVAAVVVVVLLANTPLAPLAGALNVTTTPGTGLPLTSVTFAWSTLANAELMVAL